ncbi:MAG: hypothetical protein JNK05_33135 [Myxococcales bacterium]|nr:hypothetical protein [Myxococcales bacterium]
MASFRSSFAVVLPYALAIIVGFWAHWPALEMPFAVDDYAQEAMLDGSWPLRRAPWDLYNFSNGTPSDVRTLASQGLLPWWSHPELAFRFLRPLSSLLRAADHRVFGGSPVGPHAHSLAWFALCCIGCALLFHRVLPKRAAPLAVALFAVDGSHSLPVGWLANRNFLVCTALGLLGLWRFVAFREAGSRRDAISAALLFLASLAGGEYALTILAYAAAHTLVANNAVVPRAKSALVWIVPLGIWLAVFKLGHYGASHSDAYLDPLRRPGDFATHAPERIAAHLGDLWFGVGADESAPFKLSPALARAAALALLASLAALLYKLRPVSQSVRWLALGSALALVPVLPSFGAARLQVGAQVGVAAVLAIFAIRAVECAIDRTTRARPTTWIALAAALALIGWHLPYATLRSRLYISQMVGGHRRELRMIREARVDRTDLEHARVVLVAAVDGQTLLYPSLIWRRAGLTAPRAWMGLTATYGLYRLRRTETSVLLLEAFSSEFLTHQPEMMFRAREARLRVGDTVALDGVTASVERLDAVRRVSFRFSEQLDDRRAFRLMVMDRGGMREIDVPAVGRAIVLNEAAVP